MKQTCKVPGLHLQALDWKILLENVWVPEPPTSPEQTPLVMPPLLLGLLAVLVNIIWCLGPWCFSFFLFGVKPLCLLCGGHLKKQQQTNKAQEQAGEQVDAQWTSSVSMSPWHPLMTWPGLCQLRSIGYHPETRCRTKLFSTLWMLRNFEKSYVVSSSKEG